MKESCHEVIVHFLLADPCDFRQAWDDGEHLCLLKKCDFELATGVAYNVKSRQSIGR